MLVDESLTFLAIESMIRCTLSGARLIIGLNGFTKHAPIRWDWTRNWT